MLYFCMLHDPICMTQSRVNVVVAGVKQERGVAAAIAAAASNVLTLAEAADVAAVRSLTFQLRLVHV